MDKHEKPDQSGHEVNPTLWTPERHLALFKGLKKRFGTYSDWLPRTKPGGDPGDDLVAAYDEWTDGFAKGVGAKSGGAVKFQIVLAIPDGPKFKTGRGPDGRHGLMTSAVGAALAAGFLTPEQAIERLSNSHVNESA